MSFPRAWISPAGAVAAALIAAIALLLLLGSVTETGAASGLCPSLTGQSHPATNGPLNITSSGMYNGDGATINGGSSNIIVTASNVTICNYVLKDAQNAAIKIDIGDYDDIKVGSVTIQNFNASGAGGSSPDGPSYNAGVACWYCTSLTVVDSTITTSHGYGNGIWLKRTNASSAGPDYFANNIISGGWDGIGTEPEDNPNGGLGDDTVIENNTISNCNDDGIQVEGRDKNVIVRNNNISACGAGIALAPVLVGPLTISGNYVHDLEYAPSTAFFCYKMGDSQSSSAPQITFTNNVCKTGSGQAPNGEGAGGFVQTNSGLNYKITATGNCTQTGRYVIEFPSTPNSATFNNNKYYTTDTGRFVKWGGAQKSLAQLQSMGLDTNSTIGQCTGGPPPAPTNTPAPSRTTSSTQTVPQTTQAGATFTPPPRIPADLNCDGFVSLVDALRVLTIVAEAPIKGSCHQEVDVDCDGSITTLDALEIVLATAKHRGVQLTGCLIEVS